MFLVHLHETANSLTKQLRNSEILAFPGYRRWIRFAPLWSVALHLLMRCMWESRKKQASAPWVTVILLNYYFHGIKWTQTHTGDKLGMLFFRPEQCVKYTCHTNLLDSALLPLFLPTRPTNEWVYYSDSVYEYMNTTTIQGNLSFPIISCCIDHSPEQSRVINEASLCNFSIPQTRQLQFWWMNGYMFEIKHCLNMLFLKKGQKSAPPTTSNCSFMSLCDPKELHETKMLLNLLFVLVCFFFIDYCHIIAGLPDCLYPAREVQGTQGRLVDRVVSQIAGLCQFVESTKWNSGKS